MRSVCLLGACTYILSNICIMDVPICSRQGKIIRVQKIDKSILCFSLRANAPVKRLHPYLLYQAMRK